jgi:hypothetical protein
MANISAAKTFTAIVSVATLGAAISFGAGTALAQDKNVTEDQIVRALVPEKKPLTRGLSTGPQTTVDLTVTAAETSSWKDPWPLHAFAFDAEREEIAAIVRTSRRSIWRSTSTTTRPISARSRPVGSGAGRALTNNDPKGSTTFVVAGHTDASGETYNQDLPSAAPTRSSAISSTNMASTAPIS